MTKTKPGTRLFSLFLAVLTLVCALPLSASAATVADGSATATIAPVERHYFLHTTVGTSLGASAYQYTTNDGVTGPAYCIDHGLNYASRALPITGKYTVSPQTAGAFASGYPQHSVETFLGRYPDDSLLVGLTEEEFGYATQLAVWATLGQLAIDGTSFASGRERVNTPVGDAQQMRVFRAIQLILYTAELWDTIYQTGMYIRLTEDTLGGNISIPADMTLDYSANNQTFGIKREVINGKSYYTREYIFASATSTYYSDYNIEVWADNAPAGAIFTDQSNNELPRGEFSGKSTWRVPTEVHETTINSNGFEYCGIAKLCIPVDTAPNSGEITINCGAYVMQYDIYLAKNDISYEQSYVIADPSKGTVTANAVLNWGSEQTEEGKLQVLKVNGSGQPLAGAKFTLSGTDGTSRTGTTDSNGTVLWEELNPSISYTLTETEAPAGYAIVDPVNINIQAARTNYVTMQDSTQKRLTVKKIDKQTGYSLAGAVIAFEQIDGDFYTTGTTDQAGVIQMDADQLPVGSYKVYEVTAPVGYELDSTAQTVNWTGRNDVTLTFNNVRTPTLIIYKCDKDNVCSLPGATFEVYKDGKLVTTVTTNDNGLAYVPNVTTGYYTVKEIVAPAGYLLDSREYSVYVDNYNPATTDDPRITVYNSARPMLRIVKYDAKTMKPMKDVTFAVYRDTELIGQYTTDANGEIFLYDLKPGTYTVQEIAAPDSHIVNSTPQSIELEAGTQDYTLVFLNDVKPGIHLKKLDSRTMKPLANVRFRITEIGGTFSNEYTTDANGEIDLTGLNPGTYTVEEIAAPDGYLIDDAIRTIRIEAGENAVFVFTNTKKPSLTVVKYDAERSKKLSGATFRVSRIEDGAHYLDRITGTDGEFTIENLDPGVYSVQEIDAPSGYVKNEIEFHVELFPGQNSQLVVTNGKKPILKIIKTDAVSGNPIKGATFTIRKVDGSTILTETTDVEGEIFITDLNPSVYEITEQSVPDGYLLDPIPQKITLVPDKLGVVQFRNYPKPSLTIKKIDSATGKPVEGARFHVIYASNHTFTGEINDLGEYYTDANGLIKLDKLRDGWYQVTEVKAPAGYRIQGSGVQECYIAAGTDKVLIFENVPLSTILIQKMDAETGKPLPGAWFRLRYLNAMTSMDGTTIGEYVTDENGQIEINNLDEGTYVVEEISAPAGYVLSSETTRTVYLAGENQDFITITYGNQKMGSLLIVKKDSLTGAPLSGVEFFVTDSDGAVVGNGNGKFTTDSAGSILISNLEPGKTIVAKETRTVSGYVLDDAPQTVKIKANETVTLEFRNAPKGTLIVQKIDSATGKPLPGAEFKITAANGELTADNEGLTSSNGIYSTDSNGQVVLEKLTPGTYVVTETKAPDGYELTAQPQTVVVNPGDTQTLIFGNPPKGTLIVQKYDKVSGQPLSGAEFKIVTASGEFVAGNEGLTSSNGIYVTDTNGQIILSKLNTAAYIVTETKAPDGYQLDPTPQTVVVNANDTQTISFYDEPLATLTIIKRDVDTKELLSGAAFAVKDGAGNLVGGEKQYVTGSDGTVTVTGLAPNSTVVVSEETPPAGYWNGSDLQTVVLQSGTANSVTFENRKLGTLIIRKFIEGTNNEPLKGVAFRVTSSDGTEVGPDGGVYYTDAKGEIVLNDLQPDITVKAREIKTVDGYILDGTPQDVKIIGGQTQQLTFWNSPEQTLTVQKYIEGTTTPIEGVMFLITDSSGAVLGTNNGEFTTDRNGRIVLTGLKPGTTVTAKEIKTVSGYVLDMTPQSILIKEGEAQTLTFYNKRKGGLIVEKRDSVTDKPLAGAEFKITTLDGKYVDDNEGQTSTKGVYRTDSNGQIVLTNLQPGSYVVTETKAPDGYQLDPTPQTVVVNANDTQTISFYNDPLATLTIIKRDVDTKELLSGAAFTVKDGSGNIIGAEKQYVTGSDGTVTVTGLAPNSTVVVSEETPPVGYWNGSDLQTVVLQSGAANSVTFENRKLGTLIIRKFIEGTNNEPLKGVAFRVTSSDGTELGPDGGVYYTDAKGEIVLNDLQPDITVKAREIKTVDGYILDGTPQDVKIIGGQTQQLTFWNSPEQTLTVRKYVEGTTTPIEGVIFLITDSSGAVLGTNNGEFTTDRNGRIVLTGLKPGTTVTAKELKTVSGYVLDMTPQSILIKEGEAQTLTFYNKRKGGLIVEKRDSVTNKLLAGAEFKITTLDGKYVDDNEGQTSTKGVYRTDSNGQIVLSNLQPNSYVVTETKAPEGYQLDPTPQTVAVNANDTQTISFYNDPLATLTIIKRDVDTKELLSGAAFTVKDGAGNIIGAEKQYVTGSDGTVTVTGLAPNSTVVVSEETPPTGYWNGSDLQTVVLQSGIENSVTFENRKLGTLIIRKFIEGTNNEPLKGVAFRVTSSDGTELGPDGGVYYTDAKGEIVLNDLQPDITVKAREIKTVDGYILDGTPQDVKIIGGQTQQLTFWNSPEQTLTVQKYVEGTTTPIEGVIFLITDSSGAVLGTNNGEFTTDRNGRIVLTGLKPGTTVTAKEIKTVSGYVLDTTPQSILIKEGEAQTLTFYNERKGGLIIEKRDSVTDKPLAGAEFKITTLDGKYVDDNEGQTSTKGVYRTDSNGQIVLSNLQPGSYVVREIKAPDGYVLTGEEQSVKVNANDTQTITFLNEPLCSLTITKVDSVTGKPVPGTVFKVTDGNGNLIGTYTTGNDGTVTVTGLIPGSTVVVSEVKVPAGYVLNPTPQTITVKNGVNTAASGGSTNAGGNNTGSSSNGNSLTFEDDPTTTLVIEKYVTGTTTPLKGVTFLVTDSSGAVVGSSNGEFLTDENGRIVIEGLEPGMTVTARETKTLEGYILDTTPKTIKIKAGEAQTLRFYNQPQGTLVIQKLDSITRQPLTGAEFQLTYANGGYVDDDNGHLSSNGLYTTDANGEIRISGITGTVVVKEVKAAPGYVIDQSTQTQTVTVNSDDTQTLVFLNEPLCSLTITKLDSVTSKPVQGAVFTLKDADGNFIGTTYTTGKDGTVTVTGLTPNSTVVVSETKAPDGYILNTTPQTVMVKNGVDNSLTFKNDPTVSLTIHKYIEGTVNEPLAGVAFKVVDGSGAPVGSGDGTFYTDAAGEIVIEGLEPGATITAREIKTVEGFVLDGTPKSVKITAGSKAPELIFWNSRAGTLVIQKKDSITKQPIAGAEFQLTYANGGYVDDDNGHLSSNGLYTTDANGEIRISGITGTVVVKEVKAAPGYVIDQSTQSQTVTVNSDDTQTLVFLNEPLCSLTITKLDSVTGKPVQGAVFTAKDSNGNLIGTTYTTGEDGTVTVTGLTPNSTVVVSESKSPDGYVLNSTPQTVTVKNGVDNSLTFKNDPTVSLTIHKYIEGTVNEPLAGVAFKVVDGSGAPVGSGDGTFYTDAAGEIVIEGLEPGATITAREIKTVDGFVLDGTPKSVKITAGSKAPELIFWNSKAGTLVIQKKDSVTGGLITGAQFQLTYANGEYVDNDNGHLSSNGLYTTDANGEIRISGIVGTIVAKEIKAASGYVIDQSTQTQTVTVKPDEMQTLEFLNEPLCSLTITKLDSVTGKPVPGTVFAVKDGSGNLLGTYTTGQDGTVTVTGLVPGSTVVVSEIKVPDGYVLNTTPQTITVKNGANTVTNGGSASGTGTDSGNNAAGNSNGNSLTFEDDPTTTLVIEKYVTGTTTPLKGVTFLVTDSSGAVVGSSNGEYITDENGRIVIEGLEPGMTVTARETNTLEGYVLDTAPKTIKIKAGEAQTLRFYNQPQGTLVVQKLDSITRQPLAGAEFQLTYANGGYVDNDNGHLSSNGLYTTDANGEISISSITGTVVVKEVKAAPGYVIDQSTQTQTVTVNPDDTQTLVFLNEPLCSLTITKLDSVTGKPVPGTVFLVKDSSGNLIGTYTTGQDGTVTVTGLIPGSTVVVSEIKVPAGYVLNPKPQTITVKNGANTVSSGVVSGSSGTGTGAGGVSNGNSLTFENEPTMSLTIHKYINGTANEPLAGVVFKIVDSSGAPVGSGDGTFYTDTAGEIVVDGLEPGSTITVREIKTVEGFVLDGTPKTIKIKAGETAPELTFWNQRAGELVIRKLDSVTKQPLAGVEFELTYAGGGYVDNANGHLSSNGLYTTDSHGEIHISGVTGTIVAKETRTIPGYTIDESTRIQTVVVQPEDTQTVVFYNDPIVTQALIIQKYVDGTTDPIEGVTFLVTDSSGAVVGPNNGEYVTDSNGRIVITGLTPGVTITVRETKTVNGYVLDTTPQSILIKEGEAQTLTFFNSPEGGLELIKVSESDKTRRIPNTTFEIRKKDGALVETVTTDKNGRVHINLAAGDYYAVEIEAAEGFKLDDTHHDFTVENGKTTTLTVKNKPFSGILIHKTDSVTGKGIYGVTFLLYDSSQKPIGQYTSDNSGYVYIENLTKSGRYYLRELENEGYVPDAEMKTVYVTVGETTLIEWKNIPITAQIQITKKSADYNPTNGLPAGTPLEGAVFEIRDKVGNLVDTIQSDNRGVAATRPLPLGRYTIREVKAPANYGVSDQELTAYLEHEGQIVRFEVTNKALTTGVSITKTGPQEAMAGQPVRYAFSGIANNSNVRLDSFYWRDTLPAEVRLDTVVTGTYNFPGTYKITYRVNGGDYRTLADNLSTNRNYTLAASPVALGLASNERVTEIMFVFGQAPAGFAQVEAPYLHCTAAASFTSTAFVNVADVGGVYNGQWIQAISRWVTNVYVKPIITTLPRTGY